jgi:trehalose 6-phosphate phosphatase
VALDPHWSALVGDPRRAALLVDLDGSLAPIVDDPAAAVPLPAAVAACTRLAARLGRFAVVSGRPVEFVRRHLPDPTIVVVGQYGLEVDRDGVTTADPRAIPFERAVAAAAAEAERRWPRLTVERKGRVAMTVHWRTARDAAPTPGALAELAERHGLARVPGRMACELLPPLPIDKGTAVDDLLAEGGLTAVAFAGDDVGDLAAFVAVHRWAVAAPGRTGLCVAVASEESPPELLELADLLVDGPYALAVQLGALADAVS